MLKESLLLPNKIPSTLVHVGGIPLNYTLDEWSDKKKTNKELFYKILFISSVLIKWSAIKENDMVYLIYIIL